MTTSITACKLIAISTALARACNKLSFGPDVAEVYNPLIYAARPHERYLRLAGRRPKRVLFLGMNPGPWGMAQTGVPFGDVHMVSEWLEIRGPAPGKPERQHPKRPIQGFQCRMSEVSGRRLWGLFRERFKWPERFYDDHFVANYCPLVFMASGGANITPDKLGAKYSAPLFEICDRALADTIRVLRPEWVIGIGNFAKKRIDEVHKQLFEKEADAKESEAKEPKVGKFAEDSRPYDFSSARILHPSPASPKANEGWSEAVVKTLTELGVW
jgi:single-strand selective monofunctional uracil DNA glycosylase